MGFDNECIINIQSLKGEYFCPVCRLLIYPNEALQAQCSHLYCKPCLTYVVRTTQACPYDGYLVTEADSKPLLESNKALADTIGKIPVHCLFHRSGCTWQGPLADCTSHCSGCTFGSSLVVCNRCGVQIVHRQVQEHAQSCPGVQAQAQQTDNGQGASTTAAGATSNQNQTAVPAGTPVSQAQVSQASLPPSAGQSSSQQVNPATQAQVAQAAMPNPEQWYQQQQQLYQQYYQQYPGYDPYQQQYQQYYPYQQQAVQQYQQPAQAYTTQVPASQAPQPFLQPQFHTQQQVPPAQTPQLAQQPSQALPAAQPLPHPAQATTNIQQQIQPAGQPQSLQNQAAYSALHSVPQTHSQVQPYPNPQTAPPAVPQQGMQMPQFQQTHPQAQPSHPHVQTQVTQSYPQPHAQQYSHPQAHPPAQAQTHLYPSGHAVTHPPHPSQPLNSATHVQAHHAPARAVSGYQSYPQPQPQPQTSRPAQVGAPHALHMTGSHQQPTNPNQVQAPFPQQSLQMRPPHAPAVMPNQHQPTMAPSQVQHPTPVAQVNVYPQPQQSGYPVSQRPGLQPIQHASAQPQGFPGQGPYMQQQPGMQAPVRAQAPAQLYQQNATQATVQTSVAQSYPSRPMASHGGGQQPYSQAPGLANAVQLQPTQFSRSQPSVNPSYPAVQGKELLAPSGSEKLGDQSREKGKQEQSNFKHGAGGLASAGAHSVEMKKVKIEDSVSCTVEENSQYGVDNKKGLSDSSNAETRGSKPLIASDSKPDAENGALKEGLKIKAETADVAKDGRENEPRVMQPSDKGSNANAPPPSASMPNPPQFAAHFPGSQQKPSGPSLHHSIPHSGAPQFLGHPPGQLRPQGPAQMRPAQPFGMNDNAQVHFPKLPPGATRPNNPSGGMPGSVEPHGMAPGGMGPLQSQGSKFPGFPTGHSGPPQGELLGGPPFAPRPSPGIRSGIVGGAPPDFPFEGNVGKPQPSNRMEGPGFTDGRQLELHPHGSMERGLFGQASGLHGFQDERLKMLPEEHLKPFRTDHSSDRRDFEDLKKFPRPSHLNGGISSKFNSRFPPPGSLDHSPPVFGLDRNSRPFEKPPVTFDHDPMAGPASSRFLPHPVNSLHPDASDRPGPAGFRDASLGRMDHPDFPRRVPAFGQHGMDGLTSRSPVRDHRGVPARGFGGFPADVDGNESQSFPFGKGIHEGRFSAVPSHLQRSELDGPAHDPMLSGPHKHSRIGDAVGQDMLPGHPRRGEHFGPRVKHSGDAAGLGAFRGPLEMGEPPFHGRFPPPRPFGEAFDRDLPGYPRFGEPGFRSSYHLQRFAHDGGLYRGEMEPFDNPRKRKPGSIMCRICNVDCETVEGLDMHSQTREHQKKAMDMVMSIKQQNSKKQKVSNDCSTLEEGRKSRAASFEARGKKH